MISNRPLSFILCPINIEHTILYILNDDDGGQRNKAGGDYNCMSLQTPEVFQILV